MSAHSQAAAHAGTHHGAEDGAAAHASPHGRRQKKPEHKKHAHNEGWMISFADLLTLMLCFFIMLIAFSKGDESRTRKALGSLLGSFGILDEGRGFDQEGKYTATVDVISLSDEQNLFATFEGFLETEKISGDEAEVVVDEGGRRRIRFSEAFLFDARSARFHPRVIPVLDRLAAMLRALDRNVLIEGHTDRTRGAESHFLLSASRAQAVLRYLENAGELASERLSALGFADARPARGGAGALTGLEAENRRVEIVVD